MTTEASKLFEHDAALRLTRDTLADRGYDRDEVEKRLTLWVEDGNDPWEPFAQVIDGIEDDLFTAEEQYGVYGDGDGGTD